MYERCVCRPNDTYRAAKVLDASRAASRAGAGANQLLSTAQHRLELAEEGRSQASAAREAVGK